MFFGFLSIVFFEVILDETKGSTVSESFIESLLIYLGWTGILIDDDLCGMRFFMMVWSLMAQCKAVEGILIDALTLNVVGRLPGTKIDLAVPNAISNVPHFMYQSI